LSEKRKSKSKWQKGRRAVDDKPFVRIEVSQWSEKKLPTQNLSDLKESLLSKDYNPFKSVFLQDFEFLEGIKEKDVRRQIQLQTLIEANGITYAKKHLNKHNIFRRDYGRIFNAGREKCFGGRYHEGIKQYLERGV
jgi:hypothetical protein